MPNSLNGVQSCGPALPPAVYTASIVASWLPLKVVGMAKDSVVPFASLNLAVSYTMTLSLHATPLLNFRVSTAFSPYFWEAVSFLSWLALRVSSSPFKV
ncbi:hypothetical protein D3C76_1526140 [compost metagenome]